MLALLLLGSLTGSVVPPQACMVEIPWFVREDNPSTVILRATPDSIGDGEYYSNMGELEREPMYPGMTPRPVFAQVFRLISASGPGAEHLNQHDRVAVVWWQLGASCQRSVPRTSVRITDGEVFLAKKPREASEWIDGIPTYDMISGDWYYSPDLERSWRQDLPPYPIMSVAEYANLFRMLPSKAALSDDRTAALEALLDWGNQEPQRWNQHPARRAFCQAKAWLSRFDPELCPGHPEFN